MGNIPIYDNVSQFTFNFPPTTAYIKKEDVKHTKIF